MYTVEIDELVFSEDFKKIDTKAFGN